MQENAFIGTKTASSCILRISRMWSVAYQIQSFGGIYPGRNTPHGPPEMIAVLVATAAAANIALVVYMADRLTPETGATAGGRLDAVESGATFAAKLAA